MINRKKDSVYWKKGNHPNSQVITSESHCRCERETCKHLLVVRGHDWHTCTQHSRKQQPRFAAWLLQAGLCCLANLNHFRSEQIHQTVAHVVYFLILWIFSSISYHTCTHVATNSYHQNCFYIFCVEVKVFTESKLDTWMYLKSCWIFRESNVEKVKSQGLIIMT